jgi:hypothetical protein
MGDTPRVPKKKFTTKTVDGHTAQIAERMSELYSQSVVTYSQSYRPKLFAISYSVLERMAEANPLINAILTKRCQQIRPFCKIARESNDRGFVIRPKVKGKETAKNEGRIAALQDFFIKTGFIEDNEREDDFADLCQLLIRDVLTFDQNAVEIRRDRKGDVVDVWYVDGTTIERIAMNSDLYKEGYRFAQRDDKDKYVAFFKTKELIFDYMNKRGRLKYRGYGYSPLEQMIDLVTTFLYSLSYNRDLFVKDKIPRGFLKVTGEVDPKTLNALRNHWVAEMSGYGARFNVPIVPSGKDGVGIDWQNLGQTNRDMEYHKLVQFIVGLTCAVYAIDPAELGLKTDDTQHLIGDSGEARIQESKDSGLGALLAYLETYFNKILSYVDPDFEFVFTGVKDEDLSKKEEIIKKQLETRMTIDEVREKEGLEPFNQPWSKVPMHQTILQGVMQQMGQQPPEGGAPGAEGGEPPAEGGGYGEEGQGEEGLPEEPVAEVPEDALEPVEEAEKSEVRRVRRPFKTTHVDIEIR